MHVDAELLALIALGEQVGTEQERAHVSSCPVCAATVAELSQVVALARGAAGVELVEPSPRVWEAVLAEVRRPFVRARLASVAGAGAALSGEAEMSSDSRGRRILQVTLDGELPATGLRQAWLVHRDDPGLRQTLGVLDGRLGLWTVPHEIDLEEFTVVDISQQVVGSSEHSGESVARGELVAVG